MLTSLTVGKKRDQKLLKLLLQHNPLFCRPSACPICSKESHFHQNTSEPLGICGTEAVYLAIFCQSYDCYILSMRVDCGQMDNAAAVRRFNYFTVTTCPVWNPLTDRIQANNIATALCQIWNNKLLLCKLTGGYSKSYSKAFGWNITLTKRKKIKSKITNACESESFLNQCTPVSYIISEWKDLSLLPTRTSLECHFTWSYKHRCEGGCILYKCEGKK